MPIKQGMLYLSSQGKLDAEAQNISGGKNIKRDKKNMTGLIKSLTYLFVLKKTELRIKIRMINIAGDTHFHEEIATRYTKL